MRAELRESLKKGARWGVSWAWRMAGSIGLHTKAPSVVYVVEDANWSIFWDGTYVTEAVNRRRPGTAGLSVKPGHHGGRPPRVVHFGSQYMWENWAQALSPRNRYVVNFYHGKPEDGPDVARHIAAFLDTVPKLSKIVTSCSISENRLLSWGVPREKLVRIPIGVDTGEFSFATGETRAAAKRRLGIPEDRVCIGSFQKDGVGWGDGMEAKPIKGPDVFLDAVEEMARHRPVFVLLTGPARGYVKAGLERLGVPYRHVFLDDYRDIVPCYHALDVYLMTSREEGGPKSILESMATGTLIIATACGMAPDLLRDGHNGGVVPVGDGKAVAGRALDLLAEDQALPLLLDQARRDVLVCDWDGIGQAHLEQVYAPLLGDLGQ